MPEVATTKAPKTKTKKTPAKTKPTTKPKKETKANPESKADREAGKKIGLGVAQYRILSFLADGQPHTYKEVQEATGYYSNLTAQLRAGKATSLTTKGLVKEQKTKTEEGKEKLTFVITAKGSKLLSK